MNKDMEPVIKYYQDGNEESRMTDNPLEFIRCKEIISRYLTTENMTILDVGGATGVFSFWLAKLGHKVSLIDVTPKHIEIANIQQQETGDSLETICVGDARELPFEDNKFDLVLIMGPLYHLIDENDRIKSLKEVYRVLKPGGVVCCEVISRYASVIDGFSYDLINDNEFISIMNKDINTGIHVNTSHNEKYFTDAYLHLPNEVSKELVKSGFFFKELIAVTSFGSTIHDINNKMKDENYREVLLETIRKVEKEESLMGISSHYMGVGIKTMGNIDTEQEIIKKELEQIILDLERKLMDKQVRQSSTQISEILTDDCIEFCSSGKVYKYKKGDIFDSLDDNRNIEYIVNDFKVEILSETQVLATYTLMKKENETKEHSLRSSIWKNIDGKWRMSFHQGVKLKQEI